MVEIKAIPEASIPVCEFLYLSRGVIGPWEAEPRLKQRLEVGEANVASPKEALWAEESR